MIENPFYTSEFHGEYDLISIGRLDLEEGGTIPDCQLAVTTRNCQYLWMKIFRRLRVGGAHRVVRRACR
jgi:hypothetical protein